ncbi:glucose sorbosone dehydrogenase [Tersicoccus phoenicis]|uniref:Glucose sorbosone dehydrogenase n=1 Tax=Tersicoccus phoenicis TaxID=554083 RepID=A0A1R1LL44_9MICC|nr:PQQ-dependent sugar dehydrogenase [Tersicoccus phoenicis]OMH28271.1 glucose sorbosone dehydrogenase [Tersicoccus phoenicis]
MRPDSPPSRSSRRPRAGSGTVLLGVLAGITLVVTGCTAGDPPSGASPAGSSTASGRSPSGSAPGSLPTASAVPEPTVQTVVDRLDSPWAVAFLPDGGALVTERDTATVRLVQDGTATEVGRIARARPAGEGGLLGIALSPRFRTDQRVFLYYTAESDNRVESFRYADGGLTDGRVVLTGIPKNTTHNGGRIAFGPDGYLYVGTGDAQDRSAPQDRSALGGKILRVTVEGRPAPGNPFGDNPVYSYGHRNVQGLAWDAAGRLWATELGPAVDDEVNLIRAGGNYGWPEVTGAPHRSEYIDAVVVWPSTAESSPSGAAILGDSLWVAALRGERLWQVPLDGERAGEPVAQLQGRYGRLRDVAAAPDGSLWVLTDQGTNSSILRVTVR